MKVISTISALVFILVLNGYTQNNFYLRPDIGVVWNSYSNSNPNITGNEDVANIFWDNDLIIGILFGYDFKNNFTLESGVQYHNAVNRYYLNYEELELIGVNSISLGEGFLNIPLNVKYTINTGIKNLNIIPYLGISLSTHKINSNPYTEIYSVNYEDNSDVNNPTPIPIDTVSMAKAYRPIKTNFLINGGVGLEYKIYKNIIFALYGNFTTGFSDMNKLMVDVFLENKTEHGDVIYSGNKFYLSGGFKIPIGKRDKG